MSNRFVRTAAKMPSLAHAACAAVLFTTLPGLPATAQRPLPWLTGQFGIEHDNQPRDVMHVRAEYGGFVSANFGLAFGVDAARTSVDAAGVDGVVSATAAPGIAAIVSLPRLRGGITVGSRVLLGAPVQSAVLLWQARAHMSLYEGISARARVERDRYTATAASVDTLVLMRTLEFALDRAAAPGWAAEAVLRREEFGDDNPVSTMYAWVLAPITRSARHSLRFGYAASRQDSDQSNWEVDQRGRPARGPFAPTVLVPGRYAPYYTPHDLQTHSALINAAVAAGNAWLTLNTSYGFRAVELAPSYRAPATPSNAELRFDERTFSPYRVALGWLIPLDDASSFTLEGALSRTAYYRAASARLVVARSLGTTR